MSVTLNVELSCCRYTHIIIRRSGSWSGFFLLL